MNRSDLYNAFNDVDPKLVSRSESGASFAGKAGKRNSGSGKSGWNVLSPILVAVALLATLTVITVVLVKNRNNNDPLANLPTEGPSEAANGSTGDPVGTAIPTTDPFSSDTAISYYVSFKKSSGTVDYILFFKNGDGSFKTEQYRLEITAGESTPAYYETVVNGVKIGEAPVSANVMRTVAGLINSGSGTMAFDGHGSSLPLENVSFAVDGTEYSVLISSGIYDEKGIPEERNLLLSYHDSWTGLTNENMPEASIALLFASKGVCEVPGANTNYRPGEGADRTAETVSLKHEDGTKAFVLNQGGDSEYPGYVLTLASDNFGFELYRCLESPYMYSDDSSVRAERLISVNGNPSLLPLVQLLLASKRTEANENDQIVTVNSETTPGMYKRIMMLAVLYGVDGYIDGNFDVARLFRAAKTSATPTPTATAVPQTPPLTATPTICIETPVPTDPPRTDPPPHTDPPATPGSEEEMIALSRQALTEQYPEFAGLPSDRLNVTVSRMNNDNSWWYVRFIITLGGKNLNWYYEYEYYNGRYMAEYRNGTDYPDKYPERCFPDGLLGYEISAEQMAVYEAELIQQIREQIVPGKLKEPWDLEESIQRNCYWQVKDGWLCLHMEVISNTVDPESFEYGCQGHAHLFGDVQVVDLSTF